MAEGWSVLDSGDSYALLATDALDRYHECLLHDSLAPPDEFVDG